MAWGLSLDSDISIKKKKINYAAYFSPFFIVMEYRLKSSAAGLVRKGDCRMVSLLLSFLVVLMFTMIR